MGFAFALIAATIAVAVAAVKKKHADAASQSTASPASGSSSGTATRSYPASVKAVVAKLKAGTAGPDELESAAQDADRAGMSDIAAKLRELSQPPPIVAQALLDLHNNVATVEELNAAAAAADAANFGFNAATLRSAAQLLTAAQAAGTAPAPAPGAQVEKDEWTVRQQQANETRTSDEESLESQVE